MIKSVAFRIIRSRVRKTLPALNTQIYKKVFNLTYKFFLFLKPSTIFTIILALFKRASLKELLSIPSVLILFNNIFSDSSGIVYNEKNLYTRLEANKLTNEDNNIETFFWIIIILALIKRFINRFFKLL
jgi:hypothetical protein